VSSLFATRFNTTTKDASGVLEKSCGGKRGTGGGCGWREGRLQTAGTNYEEKGEEEWRKTKKGGKRKPIRRK
jgi:hypothetical protein